MKHIILIAACVAIVFTAKGQEEKKQKFFEKYTFVNRTDFGYLFGRIKAPVYFGWPSWSPPNADGESYNIRATKDLSINMFNGVMIDKKTALGISVGLDDYAGSLITPLQLGVRRTLSQRSEDGNEIFAALDTGFGSTIFHTDNSNMKTKGGFTANPAIGYKIRMRNSSSFLFSVGYKYQYLTVRFDEWQDQYSKYLETRQHHRLSARIGIAF